jgi:hypothetical protein
MRVCCMLWLANRRVRRGEQHFRCTHERCPGATSLTPYRRLTVRSTTCCSFGATDPMTSSAKCIARSTTSNWLRMPCRQVPSLLAPLGRGRAVDHAPP